MQVATLDANQYDAREKYAEYLKACKQNPKSKEYMAIKNAYRELSKGRHVIDLHQTLKQAGQDALGRPELAIVRADFKRCLFHRTWNSSEYSPTFSGFHDDPRAAKNHMIFDRSVFDLTKITWHNFNYITALVPAIPPALLPNDAISKYFILWEADWVDVPVDPMLLKPLTMGLYVVIAAWDLTPIERAVMRRSLQV